MEHLPEELRLSVLAHFSLADLALGASLVSRSWHRIASDDALWRRHLDRRQPKWREIMAAMAVNIATTPPRECLRLLEEPHDPTEDRQGCCRHDPTKGALCLCCTCRRYHADQSVDSVTTCGYPQSMSQTYASASATVESLVLHHGTHWKVVPGLCDELLRVSATGRVEWTAEAHRRLRPPLLYTSPYAGCFSVTYTDAQLYTQLKHWHPELCDDSLLVKHRDLLEVILRHRQDGLFELDRDGVRLASCGWRTIEQTETDLRELQRYGWIGHTPEEEGAGYITLLFPEIIAELCTSS